MGTTNFLHRNAQAFFLPGGRNAVLLIHGFTGSPSHMRPLGYALNDAGYTVSGVLLPGHGTTVEDMSRTKWNDWLASCRAEYARLRDHTDDNGALSYDSVSVIGFSMGGVIATILTGEYAVDCAIAIAAPIKLKDRMAYAAPLYALFTKYKAWDSTGMYEGYLDEYDQGYSHFPVLRVCDLLRLVHMARSALPRITAPYMYIYGTQDDMVHSDSTDIVLRRVGAQVKKLLILKNSTHMAPIGPERRIMFESIVGFLHDNLSKTVSNE